MKSYVTWLLLLLLYGCQTTSDELFPTPKENIKNITIKTQPLDSICLDNINASYVGEVGLIGDSIYFVDSKFCWLYFFDKDGKSVKRELGQGRGPKEISANEICGHSSSDDGWVFVGANNDCYLYDRGLNFIKTCPINRGDRDTILSFDLPSIYTLSYNNLTLKRYNQMLYMNIYSEAPKLNFFEDAKSYFDKSKTLFKTDLNNGNVIELLGGYPPVYSMDSDANRLYCNVNYDINTNNGDFYVSYEADSLIYCYNKNYKSKWSFGIPGEDVNINYPKFSIKEFAKKFHSERLLYSYYSGLKYISELDVVVRTYSKGKDHNNDGMQIYEGKVLVGDVAVPKNFKVIGYIAPYIYGYCGIDEINEQIKIFKFKYTGNDK
ncbi:MAG: hypothetical protein RSC28_03230 [Bacteroidales bacterium]